ncbi:hypothetical protein D7Z54_28590 [Salibacterium salarium]|uniref:DUF8042 domain-containing protein n=1 Tax=Salibacterium salarium TaxID=284579 RepID=A0A3R9P477_9BACI|nr:hypothetical protein [Salibacterium salarium]RSL29978.1 hypothetical protein D7Z54_28590 [Salibacterium salarium]
MAQRLEQAEQQFLDNYKEFLQTIEEGIGSVAFFYREGFEENGDRLFTQMMEGFDSISTDSMTMLYVFSQKKELDAEMKAFYEKVEEAKRVQELPSIEEKMQRLTSEFMPAFQRWKILVDNVTD